MRFDMAALIQGNGLKRLANGSLVVHFEESGGGGGVGGIGGQPAIVKSAVVETGQQQLQLPHHLQHPHLQLQPHQVVIIHNSHVAATPLNQQSQDSNALVVCGPGTMAHDPGNGPATIDPTVVAPNSADEPEVDIVINNVVCSFNVRCHLNLRQIALNGFNVEYRRENGMVTMKLRRPYTTASIWSSGKITCTGATTEDQSKVAARRYARSLQKLGFKTRFTNFRIVNVLGTCSMPFGIKITAFSERYREAEYEPELHPGVTYKMKKPKATLKIFSTGSITVTAPSVSEVQEAIEAIYPRVVEFRKERTREEEQALELKQAAAAAAASSRLLAADASAAKRRRLTAESGNCPPTPVEDDPNSPSDESSEDC